MSGDEETQMFQRMTQAFDAPAFMRRARNVEASWQMLLEQCRHQRRKLGEMVAMRLARLLALAGDWSRLEAFCTSDEIATLRSLHEEWRPTLKMPVGRATRDASISRALCELTASLARFHSRWLAYVYKLDLAHINQLRDAYNRYYVLEKECATRSARTARAGFTPLKPVTVEDVLREFPPALTTIDRRN
jgi:hypothetical protein